MRLRPPSPYVVPIPCMLCLIVGYRMKRAWCGLYSTCWCSFSGRFTHGRNASSVFTHRRDGCATTTRTRTRSLRARSTGHCRPQPLHPPNRHRLVSLPHRRQQRARQSLRKVSRVCFLMIFAHKTHGSWRQRVKPRRLSIPLRLVQCACRALPAICSSRITTRDPPTSVSMPLTTVCVTSCRQPHRFRGCRRVDQC